jgi:hypothetical protein
MMLFSHGVNSVGVTPIDDWRGLLRRAQKDGEFFGADERAYLHDFAVFARYSSELAKKIKSYYRWPPAMALEQLKVFIARN